MRKRILLLAAVLMVLSACSTKKNTLLTRSYHNLTSKYNIYFNGNESFKKGDKRLYANLQDDYADLLPVFPPVGNPGESAVVGDMDKSIKKALKLITYHSITVKPNYKKGVKNERQKYMLNKKEYNNYVDDAYLLIGKSHFNSYNLELAGETFRHIRSEYPEGNTYYDASVWLVRCMIESGEKTQAKLLIDELIVDKKFPKRLLGFMYATRADLDIRLKQYPEAIDMLQHALKLEKRKYIKLRYAYIIAQLYDKQEDAVNASAGYDRVTRMNPPYAMTFAATIARAGVFKEGADAGPIRAQLKKMMTDAKNVDFKDQLYFALGNIDFKEGKTADAMQNYKTSAQVSVNNNRQKARSFLAVADIYYTDRDYLNAAAFYDSAVLVIDDKYPNYAIIAARASNLNKLATNITTANLEDSVQRVAKLSENDRITLIDNIIAKVREEEQLAAEKQREENENQMNAYNPGNQMSTRTNSSSGGKWYFYNQASKSFGQNEFVRKWGKRKLEDNWRRKNKKLAGLSDDENANNENAEGGDKKNKFLDKKSREYYLQNIPLTDSSLTASLNREQDALLQAGLIYRNNLREPEKALEVFERLNHKFTKGSIRLESLYQCYQINNELNKPVMSDYYRNLIVSEYPGSPYASMLNDPNYLKRLQDEENRIQNYYLEAYNALNQNNTQLVIEHADIALKTYGNHPLLPKFALIRAMAIGKANGIEAYREELTNVKTLWAGTQEAAVAKDIIVSLDERKPEMKQQEIAKKAAVIYNADQNQPHYFVWVVTNGVSDVNQLKFNLINFNLDNYSNANLNISSRELSSGAKLVVIELFKSGKESLNYFDDVTKAPVVSKDVNVTAPTYFVISQTNLDILTKDGDINTYMLFFKKNYQR
jgi:hypothetical protein